MGKGEQGAKEQRPEVEQEKETLFEVIKKGACVIFSHSTLRSNLGLALFFGSGDISPKKRAALFDSMVQKNAEYCLSGDPEIGGTAKDHCQRLIGKVDFWPHARSALERAVTLYREAGEPMPPCLKKWVEEPVDPPPQKRGPNNFPQHWKAMRDQIICMAIDWAVTLQDDPRLLVSLTIRRDSSSNEKKKDYSIIRAMIEVLDEIYGGHKDYQRPTYDMIRNAWKRYQNEILAKGKPRPGRTLLPPQGLEPAPNPPGEELLGIMRTLNKISEDYLCQCAQRDLEDSQ